MGQPPNRRIRERRVRAIVSVVMLDECADHRIEIERGTDAPEKRFDERSAFARVAGTDPADPAVLLCLLCDRRLAEVVSEHRERQDGRVLEFSPIRQLDESIETALRVNENITLGMPFGFLQRSPQCGDLGEWRSQFVASRTASPREGLMDLLAHFTHSPKTLSTGNSENVSDIWRHSAIVSGATRKLNRAAS